MTKQASDAQKAAERKVEEDAALKERGEAMGNFMSGIGSGFGSLFSRGTGQDPNIQPVITGKPASLPTPRSQRP